MTILETAYSTAEQGGGPTGPAWCVGVRWHDRDAPPARVGRGSRPYASGRDLGRTPARPAADLAACAPPYAGSVLARAHTWLDRNPVAADAVLAVLLLAFSLSTLTAGDSDAGVAGVVFSVLLIAPLVLRRRAPVAVFAAVMLLCGAQLPLADEFLAANVAALVALYTLVAYGPRRLAAIGLALMLAGAVAVRGAFDNPSSSDASWSGWPWRGRSSWPRRSATARAPASASVLAERARAGGRARGRRRRSGRGSPASCTTSSPTRCPS